MPIECIVCPNCGGIAQVGLPLHSNPFLRPFVTDVSIIPDVGIIRGLGLRSTKQSSSVCNKCDKSFWFEYKFQ